MEKLNIKKHTLCHKRFLSLLPAKYQSEDSNKLAIAYFSLASLELLGTLHETFNADEIRSFIKFIYAHLIENDQYCGFKGSFIYLDDVENIDLAPTCFAIQCLLILGDDLRKINKLKIMNLIRDCQMENGGFGNSLTSITDKDLRYCMIATTISKMILKDITKIGEYINLEALERYIFELQTYDGGFSTNRGNESHAGMIFCGVDALTIVGKSINDQFLKPLLDFIAHRQISFNQYNQSELDSNEYADIDDNGGFNGRLNKYGDTCYVFWCLGTLKLLGYEHLIDAEQAIGFLVDKTQNHSMGGFNKTTDPDEFPDPLHSFLGLSTLSILKFPGIQEMNCEMVLPNSTYEHWKTVN